MEINHSSPWYLEVQGTKTGPYTATHIQALFQEGKIPGNLRVTTPPLNGQWISVHQLLDLYKKMASDKRPSEFQPPPRPEGLDRGEKTDLNLKREDPTLGLFEALQAAKERKNTAQQQAQQQRFQEEGMSTWRPGGGLNRRSIPPQVWLIMSLVLLLGTSVWGVMKVLNKTFPAGGAASLTQKAEKSAASAPVSRPTIKPAPVSQAAAAPKTPVPPFKLVKPSRVVPVSEPPRPVVDDRRAADERYERERERERERELSYETQDERDRDPRERDFRDRDPRDRDPRSRARQLPRLADDPDNTLGNGALDGNPDNAQDQDLTADPRGHSDDSSHDSGPPSFSQ